MCKFYIYLRSCLHTIIMMITTQERASQEKVTQKCCHARLHQLLFLSLLWYIETLVSHRFVTFSNFSARGLEISPLWEKNLLADLPVFVLRHKYRAMNIISVCCGRIAHFNCHWYPPHIQLISHAWCEEKCPSSAIFCRPYFCTFLTQQYLDWKPVIAKFFAFLKKLFSLCFDQEKLVHVAPYFQYCKIWTYAEYAKFLQQTFQTNYWLGRRHLIFSSY